MAPQASRRDLTSRLPFVLAFGLLVGLPICFYCFCGPYLVDHGRLAAVVVIALLQVVTVTLMLLTRFTDPGNLPKEARPPDCDDDFKYPLQRDLTVDGVLLKVKWCRTCNFYRPPRASHCSHCNNCVEEFDHHCPWLDNCIGGSNYRFFFLLLANASVLTALVAAMSYVVAVEGPSSQKTSHIGSIVVAASTTILFLLVASLNGFHIYLVVLAQTTNEFVGGKFSYARNPFNRGWRRNCLRICCTTYRPGNVKVAASELAPITRKLSLETSASKSPRRLATAAVPITAQRVTSSSSVTALFDTPETPETPMGQHPSLAISLRSSQPSLLFNGSIDYVVPDTPTMAGTPRSSRGDGFDIALNPLSSTDTTVIEVGESPPVLENDRELAV